MHNRQIFFRRGKDLRREDDQLGGTSTLVVAIEDYGELDMELVDVASVSIHAMNTSGAMTLAMNRHRFGQESGSFAAPPDPLPNNPIVAAMSTLTKLQRLVIILIDQKVDWRLVRVPLPTS